MAGYAPRAGQKWTQDEDELLRQLLESRHSLARMAQRHGRSMVAVETRIHQLGLDDTAGLRAAQTTLGLKHCCCRLPELGECERDRMLQESNMPRGSDSYDSITEQTHSHPKFIEVRAKIERRHPLTLASLLCEEITYEAFERNGWILCNPRDGDERLRTSDIVASGLHSIIVGIVGQHFGIDNHMTLSRLLRPDEDELWEGYDLDDYDYALTTVPAWRRQEVVEAYHNLPRFKRPLLEVIDAVAWDVWRDVVRDIDSTPARDYWLAHAI